MFGHVDPLGDVHLAEHALTKHPNQAIKSANDVADFGQPVGSKRRRRLLALPRLADDGRRKSFGDGCSKADSGTHGDLDSPKSEIFTTFWRRVSLQGCTLDARPW